MPETWSAEPARSAQAHAHLVAALAARYPPLEAEGFEHHLFVVDGAVWKVYRWFRAERLSMSAELALRDQQCELDAVYAPALSTHLLVLDIRGVPCPPDDPRAVASALVMRRADPLPLTAWRTDLDAREWGARVGRALAACHLRAPSSTGPAPVPGALEALLCDAVAIYGAERQRCSEGPELAGFIKAHATDLASAAGQAGPLIHGDLHVGNILLVDGAVQFIDPGLAMAAGVGLTSDLPFAPEWDVAQLGYSLTLFGGAAAAAVFVQEYAIACGRDPDGVYRELMFWRALVLVLTLASALRFSAELQDPTRPFIMRLLPGFHFRGYIEWLYRALVQLIRPSAPGPSATWIRWNEVAAEAANHKRG